MKIRGTTVATPMPRPDWNQTNPRKADFIRNKPVIDNIICSVEGDTIAINDSGNYPLQSVTLYGKSVQNGTPTPDAPVPIVSAGAESGQIRLYIPQAFDALTIVRHPRDVVAPEGTWITLSVIAAGEGLTYKWQYRQSSTSSWRNCTTAGYDQREMTIEALSTRDGNQYRCVVTDASGKTANSNVANLKLGDNLLYGEYVYGGTPQLTIPTPDGLPGLPVSSGGNYTDENGQKWLSNIKGVTRDEERVKVFEFDPDWTYTQSKAYTDADNNTVYLYAVYRLTTDFDVVSGETWRLIFSHGKYRATNNVSSTTNLKPGDAFANLHAQAGNTWIGFLSTLTTVEEFKAWLTAQKEAGTPPTAVYKLKEPVVTEHDPIELPSTYKPNTTIVNDAGAGMAVEYVADTKAYIDNKFTELQNAILATGANV